MLKTTYKIVRTVVVTVLLLGLVLPALLYVTLTLPPVQNRLRGTAEDQLTKLLGVEVSIGRLDFSPFNRLTLHDVALVGEGCDTIATIGRLGAGINLTQLVVNEKIVVTFAEIIRLNGHIRRATPDAPLNIQPIIDALSPKDSNKPPTQFDFKVCTVIIRQSALTYDVLSEPAPEEGRFDVNHVAISNLRADIALPRMANDDFSFDISQLAFAERSGLRLKSLRGNYHVTATALTAQKPVLEVNDSKLLLGDVSLKYNSFKTIGEDLKCAGIDLALLPGTVILLSNFSPLLPALSYVDTPFAVEAHITGALNDLDINFLKITTPDSHVGVDIKASVAGLLDGALDVEVPRLEVNGNGARFVDVISHFATLPTEPAAMLSRAGDITVVGTGYYSDTRASFDGRVTTGLGTVDLDASLSRSGQAITVDGHVETAEFDLGNLLANSDLGLLSVSADVEASFNRRLTAGSFDGVVSRIDYKGHTINDITADVDYSGNAVGGVVSIADPELDFNIEGSINLAGEIPQLNVDFTAAAVNLAMIGVNTRWPDHRLWFEGTAQLSGKSLNSCVGTLSIDYVHFVDGNGKGLFLDEIIIDTDNLSQPQYFSINSEFISGRLDGTYTITSLPATVQTLLSQVMPALVPAPAHEQQSDDNFDFAFTLHPVDKINALVKLPVNMADDIDLSGSMNSADGTMSVALLAPYIIQGGAMLVGTSVTADVYGNDSRAEFYLNSTVVTKKDRIDFTIFADALSDAVDTEIAWNYNRPKLYEGKVSLSTAFARNPDDNALTTRIGFNPTTFAVADTVWDISPGIVTIVDGVISAEHIKVGREGQFLTIDGTVDKTPDSRLSVELSDINLDYIFETLGIDNVMFGGDATGTFTASSLLSGKPEMATDNLSVRRLTYNHSLMGDALISAAWDNPSKAITMKADITQPNDRHSYVDGRIMPMTDSLDFTFDADRIRVGFMLPFMSAFTSDVDGYASGHARLWGSFKYIDMVGDIYAEDLKLKVDFTNTVYYATDSVHLTPGHIDFANVGLTDIYGNKAVLNGWLTHEFFKRPRFEFVVTDAKDLLVYDVKKQSDEDIWYGRVFADGSARVYGEPGKVDIGINVTTCPKSTFTFELSDAETAYDYNFITFRDRDPKPVADSVAAEPQAVRDFYNRRTLASQDAPSIYTMDINVAVTPQAEIILVMDPVGSDKIRAYGSGDLRMTYNSGTEDLRMYGDYTLERGHYNFTLQDIIVKDFTIAAGSAIRFNGDPYAAQLDMTAHYVVNANLADLDESFLTDVDLNRTNVPVNAVMKISGDMRQPDIDFDLAFPTLNSDVYRKVRSIISTDDMMSRQIVYLLALNRFYTPDYMTATKGNELFSVASSTISSQISSLLGQISDSWNIAPSLRSDKGDFTDVEFDLALSSTLLNNRLLLNGNFGYRDNALNNNSFIGDFDIEYLLNRQGTFRLKAYNRYNDQNYYIKSALTTQGVGIQFRHDFDNMFSFLRRKRKSSPVPSDTLLLYTLPDTIK